MFSRRSFLVGAAAFAASCNAPAVQTASKTKQARALASVVAGRAHVDGAGVSLWKMLGHRQLAQLDPFLMLDRFRSSDPREFEKGFPDHPHRGFETVSIVLDGHVKHADSVGNRGDIGAGGLQWMTAGRGIVHSEMLAASSTTKELFGYQLWINLPAQQKMTKPRYQDLAAAAFSTSTIADAEVRVLAGSVGGVRGPIDGVSAQPLLVDVRLAPGARFVAPVDREANAFVVVADGVVAVDGKTLSPSALGVLGAGDEVSLSSSPSSSGARVLLFAARPIGEPVARRGPFVMNTEAELDQAVADYRSGRLVGG